MAKKDECRICNLAAGLGVATNICHQMTYANLDCEKLKEEVIQGRLEFFDLTKMLKERAKSEEKKMIEEIERLVGASE